MGMDLQLQPSTYQEYGSLQCDYRNIGVLQTTVAEIVTVKEHQRKSEADFPRLKH